MQKERESCAIRKFIFSAKKNEGGNRKLDKAIMIIVEASTAPYRVTK